MGNSGIEISNAESIVDQMREEWDSFLADWTEGNRGFGQEEIKAPICDKSPIGRHPPLVIQLLLTSQMSSVHVTEEFFNLRRPLYEAL